VRPAAARHRGERDGDHRFREAACSAAAGRCRRSRRARRILDRYARRARIAACERQQEVELDRLARRAAARTRVHGRSRQRLALGFERVARDPERQGALAGRQIERDSSGRIGEG
jgi:hypothetical protein